MATAAGRTTTAQIARIAPAKAAATQIPAEMA